LVGTDDSPGAIRAVNVAADVAARLGAELIIVYVQPSHLDEDLERLRFIEHASMDEILKAASLEILGRAKDGAKELGAANVRSLSAPATRRPLSCSSPNASRSISLL
jgi:nucleotide-binding universal stress UspA family protein